MLKKGALILSLMLGLSTMANAATTAIIKTQVNPKADTQQEQALFIKAWQTHLNDGILKTTQINDPQSFILKQSKMLGKDVAQGKLQRFRGLRDNKLMMSLLYSDKADPSMGANDIFLRVLVFSDQMTEIDAQWIWQQFLNYVKKNYPQKRQIDFVLLKNDKQYTPLLKQLGFKNTKKPFKPTGEYPAVNTAYSQVWTYKMS